jgi:hypothetical protein
LILIPIRYKSSSISQDSVQFLKSNKLKQKITELEAEYRIFHQKLNQFETQKSNFVYVELNCEENLNKTEKITELLNKIERIEQLIMTKQKKFEENIQMWDSQV